MSSDEIGSGGNGERTGMTPDLETLRALFARAKAATGRDWHLDLAVAAAFHGGEIVEVLDVAVGGMVDAVVNKALPPTHPMYRVEVRDWTGSLDAAIALAEQFGIVFEITRHPWDERNDFCAKIRLRMPGRNGCISVIDNKPALTRSLAVLVCLFDNLIAKLETDAEDRAAALSELAASDAELLP